MSCDQDVSMVTLQQGSPEYLSVEAKFKITLSNKTIHKIERVQNMDLWESYSRKLSKLSRKLGRPAEVRDLFHGTGENAVNAICQQGFDWRMNGAHGTAYGKGSYFAVAASYSDGFSNVSRTTGHKMMFLSKVIVGLYVVGNSNTVRPPPRDPNKPYELYHSCVDNQTNPTMFVVFDNDQAYPQFLISYS
ncbi:protein mono-ADP-ribosyltransferase PARP11-like [Dendronephthya gigantea]|uniref:protein mono-ADP-ribosyltransferase PARP11-like n=1 Tax=Dendronephthya gigantea TaxID=151771 RepID=UPI00106C578B|nr:protein mono-ADP-ribosyltransferase PARP11-like [Dendronephthya gigantea]